MLLKALAGVVDDDPEYPTRFQPVLNETFTGDEGNEPEPVNVALEDISTHTPIVSFNDDNVLLSPPGM
jgi:hypothetical protein